MKTGKHHSYSTPTEPLGLGILKESTIEGGDAFCVLFIERRQLGGLDRRANRSNPPLCSGIRGGPTRDRSADQHSLFKLHVPGSILGFFILGAGGVAISTGIGGALLTICCWLRVTSSYIGVFWLEIVASVTFAIGQPLVMNGVSQFNLNWMQEDERFLYRR